MDFVLFDLGGVLCDVEPFRAQAAWVEAGIREGAIMELMDTSRAKPLGDVGKLDAAGMARKLSASIGENVSEEVLRHVWGSMVRWRTFVPELTAGLTVPYGVLSTIDPIHSDALGPLDGAHPLVYSWEIEVAKPDRRAFEIAIERCAYPSQAILYLDDRLENVSQAQSCGMRALQVTNEDEIRRALGSLLV